MLLKEFLEKCSVSNQKAFDGFERLLHELNNPDCFDSSIQFFHELARYALEIGYDECLQKFHFAFFKIDISAQLNEESEELILLQLPSTFAPEDWSFTFYEGLCRYPLNEFRNKKMVELGCGNGWISISMAKRFGLKSIVGLDINPKAITSAKLNLYLNGFDQNGEAVLTETGSKLFEQVQFYESDLLTKLNDFQHIQFDAIVGCIPQVLITDSESIREKLASTSDDEFLHSLSNYTEAQGYIEDEFGLGLIARTLEEGINYITPFGKFILNLGGRPGVETLRKMFLRRGFQVKKVWERMVEQAKDTEIDSLIELECRVGHQFEFFVDRDSELSINAETAKTYLNNDGKIVHKLTVFEGIAPHHAETIKLFNTLNKPGFEDVKNELDLNYDKESKREEKIQFLSDFTEKLESHSCFPYFDTAGQRSFRKAIVGFLNAYYYSSLTADAVLVAPSVNAVIGNMILVYHPKTVLLPYDNFQTLRHRHQGLLSVPPVSTELNDLVAKIKPDIVVAKIDPALSVPFERLKQLVQLTESIGCRLVIDISSIFELNSSPRKNEVLKFISAHNFPMHVSVIAELSKNEVYQSLSCCFLVSRNATFLSHLSNAAEFNYSRTPILTQWYYEVLVNRLLEFQMSKLKDARKDQSMEEETSLMVDNFVAPSECFTEASNHPSIKGNSWNINNETLRLDYGENDLDTPLVFKANLFESYARVNFSDKEIDPSNAIKDLLAVRYGMNLKEKDSIIVGEGVAPLFAEILQQCAMSDATLVIPNGAYGYFDAAAKAYGVSIKRLVTEESNGFKVEANHIKEQLKEVSNPWLYLNFPIVNPTGMVYGVDEIKDLLAVCEERKVTLIVDSIFDGIHFERELTSDVFKEIPENIRLLFLGGISKEYAAGGIRFGYLYDSHQQIKSDNVMVSKPHYTVLFAVRKTIRQWLNREASLISHLEIQRKTLKANAEKLTIALEEKGWTVIKPEGGLFLVAKPPIHENMDMNEIWFRKLNILINNDEWTGLPDGYCRFVLSVKEEVLEQAIQRIKQME